MHNRKSKECFCETVRNFFTFIQSTKYLQFRRKLNDLSVTLNDFFLSDVDTDELDADKSQMHEETIEVLIREDVVPLDE